MGDQREIWTVGSILKWTEQYFREKGVESPRLDAEILLSHVLEKERIYLYVEFDAPLERQELARFRALVKQRAMRVPVAYIVGYKEFMGLRFSVTPDVLIPRPDTEILVEAALGRLEKLSAPRLLDIGVGSGAILLSLLAKLPEATGVAVDISPEALEVARRNAEALGVAQRVVFRCGDLYAPVAGETFDAVLSNPPYIPEADLAALAPEVRKEPRGALAAGRDGLDFYRRLTARGAEFVRADGFLALEIGVFQAAAVAALAEGMQGFGKAEVLKDYGGIERVVLARKLREEASPCVRCV